jgi:hypothetical protein
MVDLWQLNKGKPAMMKHQSKDIQSLSELNWHEFASLLDDWIARLSRSDREVILLRFYRRLTYGQLAQVLRVPKKMARRRLGRALEILCRMAGANDLNVSSAWLSKLMMRRMTVRPPPGLFASVIVTATAPANSLVSAVTEPVVNRTARLMAAAADLSPSKLARKRSG